MKFICLISFDFHCFTGNEKQDQSDSSFDVSTEGSKIPVFDLTDDDDDDFKPSKRSRFSTSSNLVRDLTIICMYDLCDFVNCGYETVILIICRTKVTTHLIQVAMPIP